MRHGAVAGAIIARPAQAAYRAVAAFHPSSLPPLLRRWYALEFVSTLFFAMALAVIEGGVISVYTRQTFSGVVTPTTLNFTVAILGATSEIANILSFVWGSASQGRPKVKFINALQVCVLLLTAVLALLPVSAWGLSLLATCVIAARIAWSGIITIRPTIWRANYPRELRAQLVGRFSTVQTLVVAGMGMGLGLLLDWNRDTYRVVVPVACALGFIAVLTTRALRVRHERQLLAHERADADSAKLWRGPLVMFEVLKRDRWYRRFMVCLFTLGVGNMLTTPILVISMREVFHLDYFASILITSSIAALVMPLAIPMWARLLDRAHVVRFRAVHSWVSVTSAALMLVGALTHQIGFFYAAAAVNGVTYAGGALAWNLGHVDFAPPGETSHYMATHVTLNGVRGLITPFIAVALYEAAKAAGYDAPSVLFALAMLVNAVGAYEFIRLTKDMGIAAASPQRNAEPVPLTDKPRLD